MTWQQPQTVLSQRKAARPPRLQTRRLHVRRQPCVFTDRIRSWLQGSFMPGFLLRNVLTDLALSKG